MRYREFAQKGHGDFSMYSLLRTKELNDALFAINYTLEYALWESREDIRLSKRLKKLKLKLIRLKEMTCE